LENQQIRPVVDFYGKIPTQDSGKPVVSLIDTTEIRKIDSEERFDFKGH
jgi:hypothetical protein